MFSNLDNIPICIAGMLYTTTLSLADLQLWLHFPFLPLASLCLHAVTLKYTLHAQQSNSVVYLVLLAYFSAFSLLFFPELSLFTDVGVLCPEYSDFIVI